MWNEGDYSVWHFQVDNALEQWLTFEEDVEISLETTGASRLLLTVASASALN